MRGRQPAQQVRQPQTTASARRRGRYARVATSARKRKGLRRARDGERETTRQVCASRHERRAATSARKRKGLLHARDGATATGARKRQATASYRTG